MHEIYEFWRLCRCYTSVTNDDNTQWSETNMTKLYRFYVVFTTHTFLIILCFQKNWLKRMNLMKVDRSWVYVRWRRFQETSKIGIQVFPIVFSFSVLVFWPLKSDTNWVLQIDSFLDRRTERSIKCERRTIFSTLGPAKSYLLFTFGDSIFAWTFCRSLRM